MRYHIIWYYDIIWHISQTKFSGFTQRFQLSSGLNFADTDTLHLLKYLKQDKMMTNITFEVNSNPNRHCQSSMIKLWLTTINFKSIIQYTEYNIAAKSADKKLNSVEKRIEMPNW